MNFLLELSRKHDELADMYERIGEDPPVNHRATAAALRELVDMRYFVHCFQVTQREKGSQTDRLLKGEPE